MIKSSAFNCIDLWILHMHRISSFASFRFSMNPGYPFFGNITNFQFYKLITTFTNLSFNRYFRQARKVTRTDLKNLLRNIDFRWRVILSFFVLFDLLAEARRWNDKIYWILLYLLLNSFTTKCRKFVFNILISHFIDIMQVLSKPTQNERWPKSNIVFVVI